MKKLFLLLLIPGILTVSCNYETFPETFTLNLNEVFQIGGDYHSTDNSVKFKITSIDDSRCPSDVVCVWQGEAVVKISVESPVTGTLELSTYDNLVDTVGSYSFELIDVSPYPISTSTIKLEDYDVTLKIKNLTTGN